MYDGYCCDLYPKCPQKPHVLGGGLLEGDWLLGCGEHQWSHLMMSSRSRMLLEDGPCLEEMCHCGHELEGRILTSAPLLTLWLHFLVPWLSGFHLSGCLLWCFCLGASWPGTEPSETRCQVNLSFKVWLSSILSQQWENAEHNCFVALELFNKYLESWIHECKHSRIWISFRFPCYANSLQYSCPF